MGRKFSCRRQPVQVSATILAALILSAAAMPGPVLAEELSGGDATARARARGEPNWAPADGSLFITANGASREINADSQWAHDPEATADEVEAGWGWRRPRVLAVVGYAKPHTNGQEPIEARTDSLYWPQTSGVFGLTFVLRGR